MAEGGGDDLRHRRLTVGVLTATMAVGMMPTVAVGVLAPFLIRDLDLSRAGIGVLVAVAAGVAAAASPAAGRLLDRRATRIGLLFVLGCGTASLVAMSAAPDAAFMALAVAVAGIGRAASNPATNRVIVAGFPRGGRGWVTGIKQSGETLGLIGAAAVVPGAALAVGWRGALALLAAGAALCFATALALGDPGDQAPPPERGDGRLRSSIGTLSAYSVAMGAAGGAVTAYLPLYAHEVGGLGVAAAGAVVVAAGVVGAVCRILSSRWSEASLGFPTALVLLASLAAASAGLLLAVQSLGSAALWAGAVLWGASGLASGSVCMLAVMAESDESNTGRASGRTVFWFGVGFTAAPPLFGWLVDRTDGYGAGLVLVGALYCVAAVVVAGGRRRFAGR